MRKSASLANGDAGQILFQNNPFPARNCSELFTYFQPGPAHANQYAGRLEF
ncbi:hypothetical protein ACFJIV_11875 [Mucilaginibacter sp. UC70_90]